MTLDVRGSLKNTRLSKNKLVVIDELFSNALEAFLIRRHEEPSATRMEVTFSVKLYPSDLLQDDFELTIACEDNGSGFGDEQAKAFLTKDTSYKDDLPIPGISHCKGSGRLQFFHHFSKLSIESIFRAGGYLFRRTLNFDETRKEINEKDFHISRIGEGRVGTRIELSELKESVRKKLFGDEYLPDLFSAKHLKHYVMVGFMHRLVALKSNLGNFSVKFHTTISRRGDKEVEEYDELVPNDLPEINKVEKVKVYERDPRTGAQLENYHELYISHYKLDAKDYDLPCNVIALCAKLSPVKFITDRYLRPKAVENNPVDGYYHVILIEGPLLDERANEQRDDFDLPLDLGQPSLLATDRVSFEEIYSAIDEVINNLVGPPDWHREQIIKNLANVYGITERMLTDTETRIRYGDTPGSVAKRVLTKYQERVVEETSKLFDLKLELYEIEPDSEEFREKLNYLAWRHTASLHDIDMANLSQLVVRRAAIIEILALAYRRNLKVQAASEGARRKDEQLIHNIFFPMRKDSSEVSDHDIWLLSEEYHYFDYIASDMPLAKIRLDSGEELFEEDIDDELAKLLEKNAKENSGKRPDIAIFNKEGAAIIVEFKAPSVSLDDHVNDLMEYAQLLAAKSKGRLKRFYGYLIGNSVNTNRLRGYTRFPSGRGFFGTEPVQEHSTGRVLGELYSEILYYEDVVERASKRLEVYKRRLNLQF